MKRFIVNRYFVPKGFSGITLYPFVFTNKDNHLNDARFVNHERIHLVQQRELLVIFFYLWYVIDFLIKLLKYRDKNIAYQQNIFEREAYQNDHNQEYLAERKPFAFLRGK
nr:hypothetical protein [uncultured Capnocytophaga sp.]